ncbi:MAG: DNA repair protein RecN [Propionicimonas sp.]
MLAELRIVDLGVIGEAALELSPGFTAVTGETGAGKTMIVTGLGLLAGAKADPALVRTGASRALVEGRWQLGPAGLASVAELGAEPEDADLLTARQVSANRSRLTVGGAQIPLAIGQPLMGEWVTVHGQAEQLRLGTADKQREVLDAYAGPDLADLLARYRESFETRRKSAAELLGLTTQSQARLRELALLQFGLDEITHADPQPAEDVQLAAEARRLQSADDLRLAVQAALAALVGAEDGYSDAPEALGLISAARRALDAATRADPDLAGLTTELAGVGALVADVASQLAGYAAGLDADPARLEWIAGRRAELQGLTRKYGATVDEVRAYAVQAATRVSDLAGADGRIEELTTRLAQQDAAVRTAAEELTRRRVAAAERLSHEVAGELAALAMPRSRLFFSISPLEEPGPHGADQIALLFTANPGSAPGPLARMASGGELSRVRLALEVVLARQRADQGDTRRTFVFDEVDAGVGGAVALEIGRRLARLADQAQVIVVTHLAQVAAFADRHFMVTKADDGQVTTSGVRLVRDDDRVAVLATMMGGLESSESAMAHARELLDSVKGEAPRAVRGAAS